MRSVSHSQGLPITQNSKPLVPPMFYERSNDTKCLLLTDSCNFMEFGKIIALV